MRGAPKEHRAQRVADVGRAVVAVRPRLAEEHVVAARAAGRAQAVLGLPTGSTPVRMYAELCRRVEAGTLSMAHVTTFNMDEYVGIPEDHPESYHRSD